MKRSCRSRVLDLQSTVASSTVTVSATTDISRADAYFFSKPVQVKNTKHLAVITKISTGNYFLRLFDADSSLAEVDVAVFAPVDLGSSPEYRSYTLEAYGDHTDFVRQSPFVAQFENTVRSFFLLPDACTSRTSSICTTCPSGFELTATNVADNECHPQGFQKAFGSSIGVVQSCNSAVTGCAYCSSTDRSVCSACLSDRWTRTDAGSIVACYSSSDNIPTGYGKVAESMVVAACKSTYNCATCSADNEKCETCSVGYNFLRTIKGGADDGDIDCVQANDLDGYGLDTGVNLKSCSEENCKECFSDYEECTKCKAAMPVLKIVDSGANVCLASNTLTGFGIDTTDATGNTIRACSSSLNCATCPSDYTSCATCTGSFPVLKIVDSGANVCLASNTLTGFGIDTTDATGNTIRACSSSLNCATCPSDYTSCATCTGSFPVLKIVDSGANVCLASNTLTGFGIDTTDVTGNTIRACSPSLNCATCPSDYTSCATCTGSFPVLKITGSSVPNECVPTSPITGFGTDTSLASTTIRPCQPSINCETCTDDYTTCMTCPSAKPFLVPVLTKSNCFALGDIPDGYGKDHAKAGEQVSVCATGCKKCQANNAECTECLATAFVKSDDVAPLDCYPTSSDIPAGFGPQAVGSKTLVACDTNQHCTTCTTIFDQCTSCASTLFAYTPAAGRAGCYGENALAIPDGVGPDIQGNTKTLIACEASASCKSCPTDHRYCATCNTNYYLFDPDVDNNPATAVPVCVLNTAIVPGYGVESDAAVGTQARAVKCFNTLCKLCQADYKKCTECLEGTAGAPYVTYALTSPEVSCWTYATNAANLPAVHGLDKTNANLFVAKSCQPAVGVACAACVENYLSCDSCAGTNFRRTVGAISDCHATGSFPNGFGPDVTSSPKVLLACAAAKNCLKCGDDYQFCSECAATGYTIMKYVDDAGALKMDSCLQTTDLPVSLWGLNPAVPNSIRPCATGYCQTCDDNYAQCKTCPAGKIKHTLAGSVKCVVEAYLDYYGLVSGTGSSLVPCDVTNCQNCFDNYLTCEECEAPKPFLKIVGGASPNTCVAANDVVGYGLDTAVPGNPTIKQCTAALNCETCTDDYTTCMTCPSAKPFLVPVLTKFGCFALADIPDGYGKDHSNAQEIVAPCAAGCKKCQSNNLECTECLATAFVKADDVAPLDCYPTSSDIPAGFGPQAVGSQNLVSCDAAQFCLTCTTSYDACSSCPSELFRYTPAAGKAGCYGENALAIPDGVGPDIQGNTKTLISCLTESSCKTCPTDHRYCATCNTNYYLFDPDVDNNPITSVPVCILNTAIVPGYGVESDAAVGTQARALKCENTHASSVKLITRSARSAWKAQLDRQMLYTLLLLLK